MNVEAGGGSWEVNPTVAEYRIGEIRHAVGPHALRRPQVVGLILGGDDRGTRGWRDLQACSALRSWGEFRFAALSSCPAPGGGMCIPWLTRQLMYRLLAFGPAFAPAPPSLVPAVFEAPGAGPLEHPAASSPATASAATAR